MMKWSATALFLFWSWNFYCLSFFLQWTSMIIDYLYAQIRLVSLAISLIKSISVLTLCITHYHKSNLSSDPFHATLYLLSLGMVLLFQALQLTWWMICTLLSQAQLHPPRETSQPPCLGFQAYFPPQGSGTSLLLPSQILQLLNGVRVASLWSRWPSRIVFPSNLRSPTNIELIVIHAVISALAKLGWTESILNSLD